MTKNNYIQLKNNLKNQKSKKTASKRNYEKKKSDKTVLLKDVIYDEDGMLLNYDQNFGDKREIFFKKSPLIKE